MKRYKISAFIIVTLLLAACSKEPDVENTSTVNMAGDWWVETYENGSLYEDFVRVITYNTADPNSGQVWFDDQAHIKSIKGKFDVDYAALSFKPKTGIANVSASGKTIDVLEGKVLPKSGHSKTGVLVDSIYLKLKFSDAPNKTYELKGHLRTGFFEDEY